jgi:TatD DNase family protein
MIPLDRLMIETDAPFLTPRDAKPRPVDNRNEPALLTFVAQALANLRGCSYEEIVKATTSVAEEFFGL